jgi:hypothetical protein
LSQPWPFDGWEIPTGRSTIVEVYPSLWRRDFTPDGLSGDLYDAYSIAAWISRSLQQIFDSIWLQLERVGRVHSDDEGVRQWSSARVGTNTGIGCSTLMAMPCEGRTWSNDSRMFSKCPIDFCRRSSYNAGLVS